MKCKSKDCDTELYYENELDMGYCDPCLDRLADQYREREEWVYFHPNDER